MKLDEAIKHAEEASMKKDMCFACRNEHRQIAQWLAELKCRREAELTGIKS